MKTLTLLFFLCAGTTLLFSQATGELASYNSNSGVGGSDAFYKYANGAIEDSTDKNSYKNDRIEGSPYLYNAFTPGDLYYGDESIGTLFYRYNAYNEEIEIKQQNLKEAPIKALGKDKKIRLIADNKSMSFKTFINKSNKTKNGYLTLISDGDIKLYRHLKVVFKEAKKAENSFTSSAPAKFIQSAEYYMENKAGTKIEQIELNNKKLLALVSADRIEDLKKFLKNEKLKVKNETDLVAVFDYLNK